MTAQKVTKADLVDTISDSTGLTKKQVHEVIDRFLSEIKQSLINDKTLEFRGFGTFEIKIRKGRDKARNPKTGEIVQVSDHGVVSFRPGKELKETIWNKTNT
jgi:nucleoid DNA-binding protein